MRYAPFFFAALLLSGCGGHAIVPPSNISTDAQQTAIAPMDEQTGVNFLGVNIVPSTLPPGTSGIVQVPGSSQITAEAPQARVFLTYTYSNGSRSTSSTGSLTPSHFIVDSNKTAVFTVTPAQSKIFRVPLSSITPSVASCTLPQAADNGITQLANGSFAVADMTHIDFFTWLDGGTCHMVSRRMNPDLGAVIRSITSDASSNVFFSDSHKIQKLTPSGTFQNVFTPRSGFTPLEVRFRNNKLGFTCIANTGSAGIVGNISGSTIRQFSVPSLSWSPFAADIDKQGDTWFMQNNAILTAINPSGTMKTLVDPALSSTFRGNSIAVGNDGQAYFGAPNSRTMDVFNHTLMHLNPTSITESPGATKPFMVFETLQPFPGTNPATFTAQSSNNAVAKVSSFMNSGGQGTGTALGEAAGHAVFMIKDANGNIIDLTISVP